MKRAHLSTVLMLVALALLGWSASLRAERIKDIATVQGVRTNQLIGYGLIGKTHAATFS